MEAFCKIRNMTFWDIRLSKEMFREPSPLKGTQSNPRVRETLARLPELKVLTIEQPTRARNVREPRSRGERDRHFSRHPEFNESLNPNSVSQ